jgi:predicted site-specific integrase-resolvase
MVSKRRGSRLFLRPSGCLSPNEVGRKLGITGEAVKNWIYNGRLKAAKADNGYYWVREADLKEFLESPRKLVFKYHSRG